MKKFNQTMLAVTFIVVAIVMISAASKYGYMKTHPTLENYNE